MTVNGVVPTNAQCGIGIFCEAAYRAAGFAVAGVRYRDCDDAVGVGGNDYCTAREVLDVLVEAPTVNEARNSGRVDAALKRIILTSTAERSLTEPTCRKTLGPKLPISRPDKPKDAPILVRLLAASEDLL